MDLEKKKLMLKSCRETAPRRHGLCFQRRVAVLCATLFFMLAFLPLATGCVSVLYAHNVPSDQKMRIVSNAPQEYAVRVQTSQSDETKDYPVGGDGMVNFHVPRLPRGCAVWFLGIIKISDQSPQKVPAIQLVKQDKVVRKLCLNDLAGLPVGADGVREVKIK